MIRLQCILLVIVFYIVNQIQCSKSIQDLLPGYYKSDIVVKFKEEWEKYQHAFENAIETGLQADFGVSSVNIYEENRRTSHDIARGFTITDGVVNVFFLEMVLRELPSLVRPKLKMDLPNNYQNFRSRVGRMFIDSNYYVGRNDSSEIYASPTDQKILSPFSLQQVDRVGTVTIIADDCLLEGFSIITLNGDSVDLGHSPVRLYDCKYTVEISTPNSGAPPVIAPYFSSEQGDKLAMVLSKPIREELHMKLQSALYSYVNTSVLFGPQVREFRDNQQDLFKSYAVFIRGYVSKVNQYTLKKNKGVVKLPDYDVYIEAVDESVSAKCRISVSELTLYGLETAYVSRSGGPYNDDSAITVADAIVFSSMQIRGKITHDDVNVTSEYNFTAEITDIAVNVLIVVKNAETQVADMKMAGWRALAFSIVPWRTHYNERIGYQSLVYGHILNELPTRVINHLKSILGGTSDDPSELPDGGGKADSDGRNEEYGQDSNEPGYAIDDTEARQEEDKKKEFFTDDNLDKDFFTDDNLDKDFFTDDNLDKDFFTDENIDKDFFTDENINKDFFTDDNIDKDIISENKKEDTEDGNGTIENIEEISDADKGASGDDNGDDVNDNEEVEGDEGKLDADDVNVSDDDGKLNDDDVNVSNDDGKLNADDVSVSDDNGKLDAEDVNLSDDDKEQLENTEDQDTSIKYPTHDGETPLDDENGFASGEKKKLNQGNANKPFHSNDFLDKDFFTDDGVVSDSSFEFRRLALKDNDSANVQISGHKKDVSKHDLSNGVNQDRAGSKKKKVVTLKSANNKETATKTGKVTDKKKNIGADEAGSKDAKKRVLPPNVHNSRRLHNPHMSENEIR